MKRITLSVAFLLLGGGYIANAQVGIGTPEPATSAQLDIVAEDKGVLIPRVDLTDINVFKPVEGEEVASLLVYNKNKVGNVTPGFYYWVKADATASPAIVDHWERIVSQTQLNEAIANMANMDNILALLKVAFPSNNLVVPGTSGETLGGGMVYVPGDGTNDPKIEYVYFNGTHYVTKDITTELKDFIKGTETQTTILEFPADSGKYYYISELAVQNNQGNALTTPFDTDGTTLLAGVVFLDIPESVAKNFETILDGTTTLVKPGTTSEYYTVEEYIQHLSSTVDGNVIYKNIGDTTNPNFVFQYWNGTAYETIELADLVAEHETETFIMRDKQGSLGGNNVTISYNYFNETHTDQNGTPQETIALDVDILELIQGNETIQNAINAIIKEGGNVSYTKTVIAADAATGQLEIPANSLYTTLPSGVKELVDISGAVLTVIEGNKENIKNVLGDKINQTTVTKTGDTFNGKDVYIFSGTTVIAANSAKTSGISIPENKVPAQVIGIKVMDSKGISSNVTDVVSTGSTIKFNIGTGNMYNILGAGTYDVIVEFTAD